MARYILIDRETQKVLGRFEEDDSQRPFVDIAEAYEELLRIAELDGETFERARSVFRRWALHEVTNVERRS
jgi:hemerythrin-like domain-containing protein